VCACLGVQCLSAQFWLSKITQGGHSFKRQDTRHTHILPRHFMVYASRSTCDRSEGTLQCDKGERASSAVPPACDTGSSDSGARIHASRTKRPLGGPHIDVLSARPKRVGKSQKADPPATKSRRRMTRMKGLGRGAESTALPKSNPPRLFQQALKSCADAGLCSTALRHGPGKSAEWTAVKASVQSYAE
jgi:hypothetical protein